jgi:hypothetical protein
VPLVLLLAAAAILGGVIVVAMGRGGELARFAGDVRPLDAEIMTAADVALLRPPAALWGYDMRATDAALNVVARTVTERDVEIATLRRQIAELQTHADELQTHADDVQSRAERLQSYGEERQAAGKWQTAAGERQAATGEPVARPPAPAPAEPLPPPFRRGVGAPRPPGDEGRWSAWERPASSPAGDPGEPGESS